MSQKLNHFLTTMTTPQSAFHIGFARHFSETCAAYQAIQRYFLRLEPDASYTLFLECARQDFPTLMMDFGSVMQVALRLSTINLIQIWNGQRLCEYRVEDLALGYPEMVASEGLYDRLLEIEKQRTILP